MAYLTGTYTGINDALNQLAAWAVTNGWTQNDLSDDPEKYAGDTFTGRRAHLYRSINGVDVYTNLRSTSNQRVCTDDGYTNSPVTGICINGSTGYSGGTYWDKQTGYTSTRNTTSICGNVDNIKAGGGTYHFFATPTNITAIFETDSTYSDWRVLCFGLLGSWPFYAASGGTYLSESSSGSSRSAFLAGPAGVSAFAVGGWSFWDGTRWYRNATYGNISAAYQCPPSVGSGLGMTQPIVNYSPDSFRGNVQLAPSVVMTTKAIANELYHVGELEGIKFVNMKNNSNGDEITYDTDTYKLFRIFNNSSSYGIAVLK